MGSRPSGGLEAAGQRIHSKSLRVSALRDLESKRLLDAAYSVPAFAGAELAFTKHLLCAGPSSC